MKTNTTTTNTTDNQSALTVPAQAGALATIPAEYFQPMPITKGSYPALQASRYKGVALDSTLHLGFGSLAADILGADALDAMSPELIEVDYGGGSGKEHFFVPGPKVRWIPLAFPSKWIEDRTDEKQFTYRPMGGDWNEKCKTACRLFLAAIVGDSLVLGDDGQPAVVSLSFRGMRTKRIFDKEKSLLALNSALLKMYSISQAAYIAHLTSLVITCEPTTFVSAKDPKLTSIGPDFVLSKAQLLPANTQAEVMALLKDESLQQAMANPFGVAAMPDGDVELMF